jgi:hypothetical protein
LEESSASLRHVIAGPRDRNYYIRA